LQRFWYYINLIVLYNSTDYNNNNKYYYCTTTTAAAAATREIPGRETQLLKVVSCLTGDGFNAGQIKWTG